MATKQRITVTLDPELVRAGQEAVEDGRAESLSAWVSQALTERVAHERRMKALDEAIAAYEAEHGVMTDEELAEQRERDRLDRIQVRARHRNAG